MKADQPISSPDAATEPAFFSAQTSRARRFYLDLSPPASLPLAVVSGGVEHCRSDYHMQRSGFRYFSVEFVTAGTGSLTLAGKTHRLSAGALFAYGPGVPHAIQCDPDRPLVKYFVDFTGKKGRQLLKTALPNSGEMIQVSNPHDVRRLYDDLISAGLRSTPYRQAICVAIVEHLLLRVAESAVAPGTIETAAFETYQRCHQFIADHYLALHGLAEIAERCHLDAAYLCRLFGRFDHESPYQYLTRLKMIHAAEQLQTPGILVKQVAARLGFDDPFQFSRSFTRVLGVSPRNFVRLRALQ